MALYKTDKNKKRKKIAGKSSRQLPLGAIFCSAIVLTDPAYKRLDGQCISINGVYSQFAQWLISQNTAGNVPTCTIGEYGTELSTCGQCGKFVINTTSEILTENGATIEANSIKLPTITAFIESSNNTYPIGTTKEAGLPNIVGKSTGWLAESVGTNSGALTDTKKGGNNKNATTNGSYWSTSNTINFDASNSNSIYGKSETVQPKSVSYPFYIVVATGTKTDAEINIENYVNDLNGMSLLLNSVSKRYLIDSWVSSDGLSWYNIYNDGWKECGGTKKFTASSNGTYSVALPITFSNIETLTPMAVCGVWYDSNYACQLAVTAKTENTISVRIAGANINKFYWTCCGY